MGIEDVYIYTLIDLAIKNEILPFVMTWMDLEYNTERKKLEKYKCHMISLL